MDTPWTDCYLAHFARYLGKPFDVQTYRSADNVPLRLATYDLRYKKYRIYGSIGMADETSREVAEVILLSDDFGKDVPVLFVNSLYFILERDIPMTSRFAVAGVDQLSPDFAEEYGKVAIYYTRADDFGPGFDEVKCEGETGTVVQGVFISWNELDFLRRKGPDAFEERFRGQEGELCSLRRPSCV